MKNEREHGGVAGTYQATSRGFGFLIPEEGGEDYFIPPRADGGAWNGDKVLARPDAQEAEGGHRRSARITAVTQRANQTVTGGIRKQGREVWLQPTSDRLPGPIQVVGKTGGVREGDKAAVSMTSYGSAKHPPLGMLKEVFGREGTRQASTEAVLYNYGIEREFPLPVSAEAGEAPREVEPAALAGRLDLREKTVITIDGASAKDLDDAVSLERDGAGRWVLGVHIADVSHYVRAGSPLDLEAWNRGTSVYFADQVIPMLPQALSNGICSLNPRVDRLALSCIMTMSADGGVVDHRIAKSVIRTTERMTYDDCNALLEGDGEGERRGQAPALRERYADILPMLRDMAGLAAALEKRRRARGSLDLDSAEAYILCDEEGAPVDIRTRKQGVSEALIESFMLAANECVAEHLFQLHKPAVYRVHEKPSADKTDGLRAMLAPLGYSLPEADSFTLQKILDAAREKPEGAAVSAMVLRSLMKARYDVENLGHFGLAAKFYCHFTSPIRRYPDLMVHRILSALLEGERRGQAPALREKEEKKLSSAAKKAAVQSSERELAAQSAEREIEKLYMAEYMLGHLGEELGATVSGVTRFGLFAVTAGGVEGLIPAEALPDDRYVYDEARMTLTGEHTGRVFSFGMPLTVVCVQADPGSGQVDFRLAGEGEQGPIARRGRQERPLPPPAKERRKGRHGDGKRAMHVPKPKKGGKKR